MICGPNVNTATMVAMIIVAANVPTNMNQPLKNLSDIIVGPWGLNIRLDHTWDIHALSSVFGTHNEDRGASACTLQ